MLFDGFMPLATLLFAKQYATAGTQPLGYPDYFAYALIICKVLGCIAISAPNISSKLREWAYAGFTFNLLFATLSHAVVDQNIGFILMPLVILAILAVSYFYNDKIKKQTINQ